jgi:hypothetical protein
VRKISKKGTAHTTMFNQGLGQPRMTVEDRICDMMMQLDEHSEKIPEGMYLQFCDHLKVFHQNIQMNRKHRQKLVAQEAEVLAREVAAERHAPVEVDPVEEVFGRRRVGPRRCGCCREIGHNRRSCPRVLGPHQLRMRGVV